MPRVLEQGPYSVYIYREVGVRHHLPHCHVRWGNGNVQVALPTLMILAGGNLPPAARSMLRDNLEALCTAWNRLNPERSMR